MLKESKKIKDDLEKLGFERNEISVRCRKRTGKGGYTYLHFDIEFKIEKIFNRIKSEGIPYPSFEATEELANYFRERAEDFVRLGFVVKELNGKWFNLEISGATDKVEPSYTVLEGVKGIFYEKENTLVTKDDVDLKHSSRTELLYIE